MRTLLGHTHAVRALAYAPGNPALLVSGGLDRRLRRWDPVAGEALGEIDDPVPDTPACLAFSPDGRRLAAGRSASLMLWDMAGGDPVPARSHPLAGGSAVGLSFTADGRALLAGLRTLASRQHDGLLCWNLDPPHPPERIAWDGLIVTASV